MKISKKNYFHFNFFYESLNMFISTSHKILWEKFSVVLFMLNQMCSRKDMLWHMLFSLFKKKIFSLLQIPTQINNTFYPIKCTKIVVLHWHMYYVTHVHQLPQGIINIRRLNLDLMLLICFFRVKNTHIKNINTFYPTTKLKSGILVYFLC